MQDLEYKEAVGEWIAPPESNNSGVFPVSHEEYIKNVRDNCLLDLPNISTVKEHDKVMVMVCGGPTAKDHLEEIREKSKDDRYRIFCSNQTHDWLIENGIVPHYHFIIDPKTSMLSYVNKPHEDVKYLIGISCNHKIFEMLKDYDVHRIFTVSGVGEPTDVEVIKALLPYQDISYVFGGSMAGLRAMGLADVMGYLKVEYYGFDSCYFETNEDGEPIYYSYNKRRKENIIEAQTSDGKIFLTSPVFASQARQFIKWKHRLEWIEFTIHGESLTSSLNKDDDEIRRPKHDLLITDNQRLFNKELHEEGGTDSNGKKCEYGFVGAKYAGEVSVLAGKLIKQYGDIEVLDYGCGMMTLERDMPPIKGMSWSNYDPCLDGLDTKPSPTDFVVCTDVLEHIEPECLSNVLDDLARITKKVAFISICLRPAIKNFSDGRNAHLIVESPEWWTPMLKKRFYILESRVDNNESFMCTLQAKEIK